MNLSIYYLYEQGATGGCGSSACNLMHQVKQKKQSNHLPAYTFSPFAIKCNCFILGFMFNPRDLPYFSLQNIQQFSNSSVRIQWNALPTSISTLSFSKFLSVFDVLWWFQAFLMIQWSRRINLVMILCYCMIVKFIWYIV